MILKGISIAPKPRTTKGYQSSNTKLYQSRQWKEDRFIHLKTHPECELKAEGCTISATVSDHKIPINQGGSIWDWSNRQALCKSCNAKKTALDNPNNQ